MINDMRKITVSASKKYDVLIGKNLIENAGQLIKKVVNTCKIAIITDDTVDKLYSDKVFSSLVNAGYQVVKFVFESGEKSKNLQTYAQILTFLTENQITRSDAIVALGGGVVGDIAGFAAATYLRGISVVQIPTTLLAQIDSSVGGKTAVDLPAGKNLVGAFKQPSLVICDLGTLETLPTEVYLDGMGEVAKYSLLDKRIFDVVNADFLDKEQLVYLCIDYKRQIVEADEFESGKRKLLNLGHTFAHSVESLSEFTISHGKAVAIGLNLIIDLSLKHEYIDKNEYLLMKDTVQKCVGDITCPYTVDQLCNKAYNDKKRSGEFLTLIVVYGVGDCKQITLPILELKEYVK